MSDPNDTELVRAAIVSHITGCCVWADSASRAVHSDPDLSELTLEGIQALLRDHVAKGGKIDRRDEIRDDYPQEYWYRVIVPIKRFKHGLFVEIILIDDDPEIPAVEIVSVHEQRK